MTRLEFAVAVSTMECVIHDEISAEILGVPAGHSVPMASVLATPGEFKLFESSARGLLEAHRGSNNASIPSSSFHTLNLVFAAPNAPTAAPRADRSKIHGVFSSPLRAIHVSAEVHLSCFTSIELIPADDGNDGEETIHVIALEYSRSHRQRLLQQEFGSWLLEEHIEKAVIATTMTGEIVFWNRFATELYLWGKDDTIGKNVIDVTPSDMTQEQAMQIMTQLQKGEHWAGFFRVHRRDGSDFMAHVTDTPILDENGVVKFIVGCSYDYTQLYDTMKALEELSANLEQEVQIRTEKLLERENDLRMVGAAVRQSDTGVLITDGNFQIIWHNDAVLRLLEHPDGDQQLTGGLPWGLPLEVEHGTETLEDFLRGSNDQQDHMKTARVIGKADNHSACGGFEKVLSVTVRRMRGNKGTSCSTDQHQHMITLRDLTMQRKAGEALVAAEKARAASESKTQMMQTLSHELRTPLQGITGVASTCMLDLPNCCSMRESLSMILASSRLLLTLINNVLDLRKIESNMMNQVEVSPVSTMACVDESIRYCEPFAVTSECELILDSENGQDRGRWNLFGHRLRVVQILINLLSNAIKYNSARGNVTVSVRQCSHGQAAQEARKALASDLHAIKAVKGNYLRDTVDGGDVTVISVSDCGKGIPPEEAEKLFQEFAQLRISALKDKEYDGGGHSGGALSGQSSGSGLGLTLAMQLLAKMNGHIWANNCDPKLGKGTGAVFSICLPTAPASSDMAPEVAAPMRAAESVISKQELDIEVLVVDDSVINVKVLTRMLERLGVRKVVSFLRAAEALEYLSTASEGQGNRVPELIISDLKMPGMDGYQFVRLVRERISSSSFGPGPLSVMACSADWTPETEAHCLSVGFDGIIRKPVTISELRDFLLDYYRKLPPRSQEKRLRSRPPSWRCSFIQDVDQKGYHSETNVKGNMRGIERMGSSCG